jgi:hypothetical protein
MTQGMQQVASKAYNAREMSGLNYIDASFFRILTSYQAHVKGKHH